MNLIITFKSWLEKTHRLFGDGCADYTSQGLPGKREDPVNEVVLQKEDHEWAMHRLVQILAGEGVNAVSKNTSCLKTFGGHLVMYEL